MENEVDTINLPRKEDLLAWLAWLVPVIFLLLWDVWKAWKRWAPWIPGQALVLSPFIIRLLSYIDYSHISVYSGSRYQTVKVEAILVKNQKVIDSGRLMMCVLIAYLIPGMARSSSITDGSNLAALALSITFHVVSEFRSDWKVEKRNESLSALAPSSEGLDRINSYLNHYIFAIILISAIIYLLLLLIHAVMIGRTIRSFISQKIPSAISCCCTPPDRPRCNDIKDHVLKCWIVVRLCQPDYVLSRSSLCSTLWPTVTSCFGFYIIIWKYIYNESLNSVTKGKLVQLVIVGQIVLVGIGWIVLLVRWVTSDRQGNISGEYYFYGMNLQDWKSELEACFIGLFVRDKRIQEKIIRDMNKKIRDMKSLLWYPWHWVPHWLSIIKQKLSNIKTCVSASVSEAEVSDDQYFSKYKDTLNMLLIPGESAGQLWEANRRGFSRVERYMKQGIEDGKRSSIELICLLKTRTPEDKADRERAVHFQQANKNSWKRTSVSLIHSMIKFRVNGSDASDIEDVIEDAMQCHIQGWEYMDIVDGLNEEVKSLGRQADGEFDSLQHTWNKRAQPEMPEWEITDPLDSRDSTDVAKHCLFETWTVIDRYFSEPEINKIECLQRVLAKVYFFYMTEEVNKAVIQKCSKLAEERREEEILEVAYLSAKAQAVLDKVREGHKTDQASTSSPIQTDQLLSVTVTVTETEPEPELVSEGNDREDPVKPRHNTDRASTSSTIPTEIELAGKGKGQAELPPIDLIQSSYPAVGQGNDQAQLPNNTDQGSISSSIQTESWRRQYALPPS